MRLLAAIKTDALLQARNQLFAISAGIGLLSSGALAWLSTPAQLWRTAPMTVLMFVGGSTLLYVVAMIILEKDDGTLGAVCVSPLRPWEYLAAKVVTLTALALIEALLICGGAHLLLANNARLAPPGPWLIIGVAALGGLHVLLGVVLVARYTRLLEALLPMGVVAMVLQLPAFYFVGAIDSPLLLAIPSAPPTMLVRAAYAPLSALEWAYALIGTLVALLGLGLWARAAFERHIVGRTS